MRQNALARRHHHQPVRLPQVRADLGDQLRRGDPDRCRQLELVADRVLDPAGDRGAVTEQGLRGGDVEEGLVDRDRLHQRREAPQDGHDLAAHALVLGAVDRDEDAVGAEAPGRPDRHSRVDAERAGLVRGRAHDAAVVRPPMPTLGLPRSSGWSQADGAKKARVDVEDPPRGGSCEGLAGWVRAHLRPAGQPLD
jgi:hypothetical protein